MQDWIILSPSKEMDWSLGDQAPYLDPSGKKIIKKLRSLSQEVLTKCLGLDQDLGKKIYQAYRDIDKAQAKAAIDLYQGLVFRQIPRDLALSDFGRDHLLILSALYGPVGPQIPINPYRLDFTKALEVEGEGLKSLQKKNYTRKLAGSRVYNLASQEFAQRIDKKALESWVDISFYRSWKDKKKAPSATAKKLRGQLARHILARKSLEMKVFEDFQFEGYHLNPDSSQENLIYSLDGEKKGKIL